MTRALWYAVAEAETLFKARLAHAGMLASLYGNSSANLEEGNSHIHRMYLSALDLIPYVRATKNRSHGEMDDLVAEWRRINGKDAASDPATHGTEEEDGHA